MSATLVQKKGAQTPASAASLTVTLDSPPTPGNTLIACCNSDATVATPAGFSLAVSSISGQGLYIFYRVAQSGDGAAVVFVPSVIDSVAAGVLEYSGLTATPLDKTASGSASAGSTSVGTGTTGTTAQAAELLIACVGPHAGAGAFSVSAWTNSFTEQITEGDGLGTVGTTIVGCFVADRIVSATGAYSSTATYSPAGDAGGAIATFKIADTGQTVAVGHADETDSARAVGRIKTRSVGSAAETDTAQQIRAQRIHALGTAAESDVAMPIRPVRSIPVGTATEADSARAVSHSKARTIGLAVEADTAVRLGAPLVDGKGKAIPQGPQRTGAKVLVAP